MKKMYVMLVVLVLAVNGFAEAEPDVDKRMKTSITLGASRSDGNKKTMQANAAVIAEGEKERLGSIRAGIEANYGESTVDEVESKTVDNTRGFANIKKTLSEKTFAYIDGSILTDDIAEVDYRAMLGTGLGVYLVKNKKTSFFIEGGLSYIWEDVADVSDDYLAYRVAERLEQKLSGKSKIWQSAEYIPEADDFDNYLVNIEIGAEAALNSLLNLRIVLQDKYDSTPGEGLEKNDVTLIAGISINI